MNPLPEPGGRRGRGWTFAARGTVDGGSVRRALAAGWALLAAVVALCPFGEGGGRPTTLFLLHTLLLAAAGCVAVARVRAGAREPLPPAGAWILAALAALGVASLRAPYGFAAAEVLIDASAAAVAFLLAGMLCDGTGRLRTLALVLVGSGCVQAAVSFAQRIRGGGAAGESARPAGTLLNPNHLAAYIVVALLAGAGWWLGRQPLSRRGALALGGALAVLLAGAVLPASRGAMIGLAAGLAFGATLAWRRLPEPARRVAILAGAAGLLAGVTLLALRFRVDDPYRWERVTIWRASLVASAPHPVLGLGPGQFSVRGPAFSPPHDTMPVRFGKRLDQTHSDLLRAFVEGGLLGGCACLAAVAALLAAMARGLSAAMRGEGTAAGVFLRLGFAAGVVALLAHASVENISDRPALALTGAILAGAAVGPASRRGNPAAEMEERAGKARGGKRAGELVVLLSLVGGAHLAAVSGPWLGWRDEQQALGEASRNPDAAREWIEAAIRWNPFQPAYRATRGGLTVHPAPGAAITPGALSAAVLDVREARRLSPEDSRWPLQEARLWRAAFTGLFHERSSLEEALAAYREAGRLAPVDPFVPFERATLHASVGEREAAFAGFDQALAIEPNFHRARLARARLAAEGGDAARAATDLREAERRRAALAPHEPADAYEREILSWSETDAERVRRIVSPDPRRDPEARGRAAPGRDDRG